MSFPSNAPDENAVYTGHDVVDEQGRRIGKVVDVIYDDRVDDDAAAAGSVTPDTVADSAGSGRRPSWLVVDPGVLRTSHYLPTVGAYRTGDGTIVTPWDRDWVKAGAKARNDHIISREQRAALLAHYSLTT